MPTPSHTRPGRGRPQRGRDLTSGSPTRARLLALRVLERVERSGAYADLLLNAQLGRSNLAAGDRAFATDLVNGTLRWRGRLDFLLTQLLERDLEKLDPLVANALRLGAYQIVCNDRVPDSAAVDQTVRCVRAAGAERATGLVNAVLRKLAATHEELPVPELADDPLGHLTHALSLPPWLADRWLASLGAEEAAALANACNVIPPLTIRANRLRTTRDALLAEMQERFPDAAACRYASDGIVLGRRGNPALDPAFLDGRCSVQDEASQLVVALLDPQPGEKILDACAAPGGKASAIAERIGASGKVVAADRNGRRLGLVRRQVRRLDLAVIHCVERDATQSLTGLAAAPGFDRVLVDAPCSGIGTLRRHPDARWRVRPADATRLADTQGQILRNAATVLRPGGTLVYSTCTLLREENEDVITAFLNAMPEFTPASKADVPSELDSLVDADATLRCFPHLHDTDGFFAAKLVRAS